MNPNEFNGITEGELLQANATVIAGTLIFLTINSFTEGIGIPTVYMTYVIVIPFSLSSIFIIYETALKNRHDRLPPWWNVFIQPKTWSFSGFVYLIIVLGLLATSHSPFIPVETVAEKCAINPEIYNVTHASDCSKFIPGSLAEDCALHPEKYKVQLKQCSKFILTG
jgi:hypothetical protein